MMPVHSNVVGASAVAARPTGAPWFIVCAEWRLGGYRAPHDDDLEFQSLEAAMSYVASELRSDETGSLIWDVNLSAQSVVARLVTPLPDLAALVPKERWIYGREPDGVLICRFPCHYGADTPF